MNGLRSLQGSVYIEWAKTSAAAHYNLASSGLLPYPLRDLPITIEMMEWNGDSLYGYAPLQTALASKCHVKVDEVVATIGTSMANHLAMAAILAPGDEVLIESPTYEALLALAHYLGTEVKRFPRRAEDNFQIDLAALQATITPRTRLIVLTNLHNPTGAFTDLATLKQIGEMAATVNAYVLVDEVYLEALFARAPHSAFHLGSHFIATSSLTKAYGLGGLRCGWILAEATLAKKIWRLNDLFGIIPVHAGERLSVIALNHLSQIAQRAETLLTTNRNLIKDFFDTRKDLKVFMPLDGTVVFPRLINGSVDKLCQLLRDKYETSVVPGKFFELPAHFRMGIGIETPTLKAGLTHLANALAELSI